MLKDRQVTPVAVNCTESAEPRSFLVLCDHHVYGICPAAYSQMHVNHLSARFDEHRPSHGVSATADSALAASSVHRHSGSESLTVCARLMMASSRTWRGVRLPATTPPRVVEGKTGKTILFRMCDPAFETIHHFVAQRTTVRQMR